MLTVVPSRCDVFRTLFEYIPSLENVMPFGSKSVAMCLRRGPEVTKFSSFRNSRHFTFRPTHQNLLNSSTSLCICIPKHYPMSKGRASPGVVWFAVVCSRLLPGFIYLTTKIFQNSTKFIPLPHHVKKHLLDVQKKGLAGNRTRDHSQHRLRVFKDAVRRPP
jgi:hypothetical protein